MGMGTHRSLAAVLAAGAVLAMAGGAVPFSGAHPATGGSAAEAAAPGWTPFVSALAGKRATVWALGDAADGGSKGMAVAEMLDARRVGRFLYLGDVYDTGTADEFAGNYAPAFGRFDDVAAPTIGNHEYDNRHSGYEPYWEAAKGRPPMPWYSFRVAGWQFLSLNSMEPLTPGSPQDDWLRRRLRRTPGAGNCRIAFTHKPRFSAGPHGDQDEIAPAWSALAGRAKLLLGGHDHHLERRAPVDGITQLVAGAGGHHLRDADELDPGAAFVDDSHFGAVRLQLRRNGAIVSFVADDGELLDRTRIGCTRRGR